MKTNFNIIFIILILGFTLFGCNKNNSHAITLENKPDYTLIENKIYFKSIQDASIEVFHENKINYKRTVLNEFLPVTKQFRQTIIKNDITKILINFLSDETLISVMKLYKKKGIKIDNKNKFIQYWINLIKSNNEKIMIRTSLNFILDKSIPWEKYSWRIVPQCYVSDTGKFMYTFDIDVKTNKTKPFWYAFKFIKQNNVYKLTEVDVGYEQTITPFYQ